MAARIRDRAGPRLIPLTLAALAFGIVATLIVAGLFVARSVRALEVGLTGARTAEDIGDAASLLRVRVAAAEVAERDYLLSGASADLAHFRNVAGAARSELARFEASARRNAWADSRVALLGEHGAARLAALAEEVDRFGAQGGRALGRVLPEQSLAADRTAAGAFEVAATAVMREAAAAQQRAMASFRAHQRWIALEALIAALVSAAFFGVAALGLLVGRDRLVAAKERLRRQTARLTAMADHIRDGVAVFGPDDRLLLWNQAFFPTSGFPPSLERVGTPFARFAVAAADWFPPLLGEPRPQGEPIVAEMQRHGRVLEVWRSALTDGGQIVAIADISKRVEAEQMVRQVQKMDALGQLTGGIAHDMNNLLQVISANLEQLGQRLPAETGIRMRLDAAMAGVARGANLTRHLLAFARRQPLTTEVIDPGVLLRGTVELLRRTLGETYEVRLALDEEEESWLVRTDPQQLENAVLNLALNARDAMPGGGRVVIIVTNRLLDAEYAARHPDAAPGEYVMIAVADTGEGMTAEQIAHAVEPFYTTKGTGRGTGLGLSMVYGLVRQSGGHFHIDSVQDGGTTVRLYLPRSLAELPATPAEQAVARGHGETVLVVEDDPAVRAVVLGSIRDLGYHTLEAGNADAALVLLRGGARPDVLFSDVVMPGNLGAADLAREARRISPSLAVVFTSGYADDLALEAELAEAATRLLPKPWTESGLAMSLREALKPGRATVAKKGPALKVLLVEDDPMVGETTADMLGTMGHEVFWASSATEARSALDGTELIIADAGLPDGDGAAFAEEVRRAKPEVAMIVISGRSARSLGDHAIVWMEKPFDEAKLRAAIARAREGAAASAA